MMKIALGDHGLEIEFPNRGHSSINLEEVQQIDLDTIPTMTVDVDLIMLGFENGEFLEITDEAEGFRDAAEYLSARLSITPSILLRFPIEEAVARTIWERKQ